MSVLPSTRMRSAAHTVVITGAASGLGRALARAYRRRGCALALIDVDGDGLRALQADFGPEGQLVTVHQADVAKEHEVAAAHATIVAAHATVDRLINNAGISISRPFARADSMEERRLFEVNYWGCVDVTRRFLPDLMSADDARLVNVASLFGSVGFPGKTAYAASKAALIAFTRTLRQELRGTRVKACWVIPPPLDTDLVRKGAHVNEATRAREVAYLKEQSVDLDEAAERIVRGIEQGSQRVVVGWRMRGLDLAARMLPGLVERIVAQQARRLGFV